MKIIEATCTKCGDTFIPNSVSDTEHAGCGGNGIIVGIWTTK